MNQIIQNSTLISGKNYVYFRGSFSVYWEQRKLGVMGNTYSGLSGKTKEDFGHGQGKFITYMNVFTNPIGNKNVVESIEIDARQNEVHYGDVFFTTSSETPEEVGMSSVWLENMPNTYLNSFCFGYRPNQELNLYYLAYVLRSDAVRKKIIFLAQGISRYNISKNKVMEIQIPKPENKEQDKLGKFFSQLDNLITLHQRKYEKLKNLKTALLEKMFPQGSDTTPKIRFKGFTDAWEQHKLGEVFDYERPDAYIVASDKYSDNYCTPVLTANKGFVLGYTNETRTCNKECII